MTFFVLHPGAYHLHDHLLGLIHEVVTEADAWRFVARALIHAQEEPWPGL